MIIATLMQFSRVILFFNLALQRSSKLQGSTIVAEFLGLLSHEAEAFKGFKTEAWRLKVKQSS